MEGVGSRQSRASARYGPGPSATVFNGPVRKWKKQWVNSQSSNGNNRNDAAPLILCRWTPLSATDEPRKRRFRYAPVVPIEKGNMEGRTNTIKRSKSGGDVRSESDGVFEKPSTRDLSPEESQEPSEDQADSNKSPGFGLS